MAHRWKTTLLLAGLFILGVALMMGPSYTLLVKPRGEAFDLFWIWAGGRAVLRGENPYGPETTRLIQRSVFGHIIPPDKYQHGFPHPAHIAFVLFPFIVLPFSWSVLLWLALQLPLFMATLLLGLDLLDWRLHPAFIFPLTLLTTLGFRYPMIVYVLGQLVFFVLFCFAATLWLYRRGHVRLAAAALACATIRPDLALPALAAAAALVWRSPRRKAFLATLLIIGAGMALLPVPFLGLWPVTWIRAMLSYGQNPFATWPPGLLPGFGWRLALAAAMVVWLGRYALRLRRSPTPFRQALFLSAVVIFWLTLMPQTGSYTLTLLLIPALVAMRYAPSRRWKIAIAVSLLSPWLYFGLGKAFPPFDTLIFLLLPLQFLLFQEVVQFTAKRHKESGESQKVREKPGALGG